MSNFKNKEKLVIIDNYDSFTYNIVEYFKILNCDVKVFKNDEITVSDLKKMDFSSIILSPGPNSPKEAGITLDTIDYFFNKRKILGVCLGHQALALYFGLEIAKAKEPIHGETSKIYFKEKEELFLGFQQGFLATRYHSLIAKEDENNKKIEKIAWLKTKEIMALKASDSCFGVQFHPEAILTQGGINIFKNFLMI